MSRLYDYFEKLGKENKLVQAYLIGNTKYENISEELNKILNDFVFNNNSISNIDIKVLKPENGNISKEKIKEVIEYVSKTSQFNNNKVYIIDECELLNDYSYNAILKTLEEPQTNVYAFLITKNMEAVKETISSRCQKIFLSNDIENYEDTERIEIANELFELLENKNEKIIYENYDIYNKIQDRNELLSILNIILNKYDKMLNEKLNIDKEIDLIGKKIIIIDDIINKMDYNLNKNLCIDRLIVEMWRCNNENSRN